MSKRPISITIISCLFLVVGAISLAACLLSLLKLWPLEPNRPGELLLMCFTRLLTIVCGIGLWYGFNWARWLALAWMAFHLALSLLHSMGGFIIHSLFLILLIYFFFRQPAAKFFRSARLTA